MLSPRGSRFAPSSSGLRVGGSTLSLPDAETHPRCMLAAGCYSFPLGNPGTRHQRSTNNERSRKILKPRLPVVILCIGPRFPARHTRPECYPFNAPVIPKSSFFPVLFRSFSDLPYPHSTLPGDAPDRGSKRERSVKKGLLADVVERKVWVTKGTLLAQSFCLRCPCHCTTAVHYLKDVGKLALSIRDVPSVPSAEGNDALLEIAERLVDVHALLLNSLVGNGAPFQPLLRQQTPQEES